MNGPAEEMYADIIDLPHHVSLRHPAMSMAERAAQFSPFAALTGHDAAIAEAARVTEERPLLDESVMQQVSDTLQEAARTPGMLLHIRYFVPDSRKAGGSYAETCGRIARLRPAEGLVIMEDGTRIRIVDIVAASIQVPMPQCLYYNKLMM